MSLHNNLGPVVRGMISANHWLSRIKINRLSWYLTLVSSNQASSNSALDYRSEERSLVIWSEFKCFCTTFTSRKFDILFLIDR